MSSSESKIGSGGQLADGSHNEASAYQSVRAVQHVLVNMLETMVADFTPPRGLSRMSSGDTRIWDEQEGRRYRGEPPLPGSCHRTSMKPELPKYWAGAQAFAVDDGSEADTVEHGSLHGNTLHVFLPWGICSTGHGMISSGC